MAVQTQWESIKVESGQVVERVKELVHEGNVRRIVIRQHERVIAEFPLTLGVLGAMLAPVLAAIGAIAAFATDCTIDIERSDAFEANGFDESPQVIADEALER